MGHDGQGLCAVVTGAASGIGREVARVLADSGHSIALLDRDAAAVTEAAEELAATGAVTAAHAVDVTDPAAVEAAVTRAREQLGAPRKLVNAAGITLRQNFLETSVEDWNTVLAINLSGYFHLLKAVVPRMRDAGGGAIVQVSSITAHTAMGATSYTASKGGVLAMTRQLAGELAPIGIRINSVSPGVVHTALTADTVADQRKTQVLVDRIPVGRIGEPVDIAQAAAFLLSDAAGFITGTDLVVDGGMISKVSY